MNIEKDYKTFKNIVPLPPQAAPLPKNSIPLVQTKNISGSYPAMVSIQAMRRVSIGTM